MITVSENQTSKSEKNLNTLNEFNFSNINITIVGLGLIGGSLAKAIRKNIDVCNLWAIDVDESNLKLAKDEGIIDEGYVEPKIPIADSDITIFSTYPGKTVEIIRNNLNYFKPNSIVTDTSGIKNNIVKEINTFMRDDVKFIGGHPMSGKESKGYEFSDECIFENAEYILTPNEKTSDYSMKLLTKLIKEMGFKKITLMSSEAHDKRIAFTSQLPHIIACTLMNNHNIDEDFGCIGGSFRDMTRIADINSDLWCELIYENKANILDELKNFILDLKQTYDTLSSNDVNSFKLMMQSSCLRRKDMTK